MRVLFMKLGFICLNVPGHLNPMTALARQLQVLTFPVVAASPFGSARTARISVAWSCS
jgi:hypothetical protein